MRRKGRPQDTENRGIDKIQSQGVNREIFTMLEGACMQMRALEGQINSYSLIEYAIFFSSGRFCAAKCLRVKESLHVRFFVLVEWNMVRLPVSV